MAMTGTNIGAGGSPGYTPTGWKDTYDPYKVYGDYNQSMKGMAQGAYGQYMNMAQPGYYNQYVQKPWTMTGDMNTLVGNQMGGAYGLINENARRVANAGVASTRGGYGSAPGIGSVMHQGLGQVASQYPSIYSNAIGQIGSWQDRAGGLYGNILSGMGNLAGNYASGWGQGVSGLNSALAGQQAGYNQAQATDAQRLNDWQWQQSKAMQESANQQKQSVEDQQKYLLQTYADMLARGAYGPITPSNPLAWNLYTKLGQYQTPSGGNANTPRSSYSFLS